MRDNDLIEDFLLRPVPEAETLSGLKIATVLIALGLTLPVFTMGSQIVLAQGLAKGSLIIALGCGITALVALVTSLIGSRLRVSTYVLLTMVFGNFGGKLLNLMFAVMLIGWFANVADMLSAQLSGAVASTYGVSISPIVYSTVALMLMTLTGTFGFRIMERFASVMVPILSAFMLYVLFLAIGDDTIGSAISKGGDGSLTATDGLSAVVGSVILAGVLAPDFTRYARDGKAAARSVLALAIGYPLIMLMAAIPALVVSSADTMDVMMQLGLPSLALVVLALSTWSSNTGNLYSSTLTLATVFTKRPIWQLGLIGFVCAWLAAYLNASNYFVPFLVWMGVAAIPVAGVYICAYVLHRAAPERLADCSGSFRAKNFVAWLLGTAIGSGSVMTAGFLVPVPALEGLAGSVLAFLLLNNKALFEVARERREDPTAA
ncbi:cytosine permease [Ensifer sp. HO-A22]|uniref:Cytosine permease n=1 Tax=Ensifer oleiphilus TaxID=2742698 RepID=A0A7Y6QD03_9HYPH|nr:cytosine permease [Ensifer oleiphilus]NVD43377.1 cytosine permease [Ensifer oleiphilus]